MAFWLPIVLAAVAGAASKKSEADAANQSKQTTYSGMNWMTPMDHYNPAYTEQQNADNNMGEVAYGQWASMIQNLLMGDLGGFMKNNGKGGWGGGVSPPRNAAWDPERQYRGQTRPMGNNRYA